MGSSEKGLSISEAAARLTTYGQNSLKTERRSSPWHLLLKQFKSALIYLLIIACLLSFALGDLSDGFVILTILLINTGLGFFQEFKSEKAVENLQKLVSREVAVIRGGDHPVLIDEKYLVPGDVVILKEGDIVPADISLFLADDLSVDESQLSGESVAVVKTVKAGNCEVYAGSTVEQGEGRGVVFATGANTRLGQIAKLSGGTLRVTQYEKSLSEFSGFLLKATFITLLVVFIAKLAISGSFSHVSALALFMIALAIAVVPEAMPVIATVTLSSGALKLAKKHVIAKTLSAVEDLGNVDILCSDKTGTLTENKLSIKRMVADDQKLFMRLAMASLESVDVKHRKKLSAFDQAFVDYVPKDIQHQAFGYERIGELPFDPVARRRRVVFADKKRAWLVEIGAVETLLSLTKDKAREHYMKVVEQDGKQGLRHLGIAYKEIKYRANQKFDILKNESGLSFAGFVALDDPLKNTAKKTVATARGLGVEIKILSGDSREVTKYVASEIGLMDKSATVYTGDELKNMSDLKLAEVVKECHAFARLDPEQKYRIIRLLKMGGAVVGYQGDGINDAPSLKLADVAIAVSHATDVARDSADILLLRNDLSVVINGINYGRGIFANINKYIRYTMIGNFGNFFALSALYLLSKSLPLLTVQLLLTNMLGDVPLVAISTDSVDPASLQRPSKYNMHALIFISIILGSYTALFEVIFFALVNKNALPIERTCLFLFLTLLGFVVILAVRNRGHFWKAVTMSRPLIWSFGGIALLTLALIYFPPTAHLFSFSPLKWQLLGLVMVMTGLYFYFLDLIKVWFYRTNLAAKLD